MLCVIALLLAGLAIAAPYAGDSIHALQSGMCHQRTDRCFYAAGHKLGLCARCLGIYLGFASVGLVFVLARRTGFYRYAALASLIGPLLFGIEQVVHFAPGNGTRFVVGIGLGLWLGFTTNWLLRN